MSKNTWRNAFIILSILGLIGAYYADKRESPRDAYKRGYLEGERHIYTIWLEKGYIPTDSNNTGDIWYSDTAWADSTDTMPAIDYTHPDLHNIDTMSVEVDTATKMEEL